MTKNNSPYRITNKLNIKKELKDFFNKKGYNHCKRCNKKLTDPNSMLRKYGLTCYNEIKENNKIIQLDLTFYFKILDFKNDERVKVKK